MAKYRLILLIFTLLSNEIIQCNSEKILFFIGFGGPSHRLAMEPLASALASKGHEVTFLVQEAPSKPTPKINYFTPEKASSFFKAMRGSGNFNFYDMRASGSGVLSPVFIQWFGVHLCELLYSDPEFLKWLHSNKFDLVVVDALFNECGYGIAHFHSAKTVLFSISTILPWITDSIGIPDETSFIPDPMIGYPPGMSFFQRTVTSFMPIFWKLFRQLYTMPKLTSITQRGLDLPSFPDFYELEQSISLVLVNTHPAQEYPRSLPPNVIPVGGISWVQKEKNKGLPKDLEDFINAGKEGFVYISFGSFIDFLTFPKDVQERFLNTLWRLPNIQFIWKLNKTPENLPKNVLVQSWLPQQDLLYHSKIRAFITHAGIGGVNEAIYTSVPLILFPIFTEQDYNAHLIESKGCGIKLEITEFSEDKLESAILKVISDATYKSNMEKLSKQFLDRPLSPLEQAVWHVEYVLRQDTGFLRPHNVLQPWWVKRQLDVWLFLLLITTLGTFISYKIAKLLIKRCCTGRKADKNERKIKKN